MPNNIVIKRNGKFEIVPSDADIARSKAKEDKEKLKAKLTDEQTRALLLNFLVRIEALEHRF